MLPSNISYLKPLSLDVIINACWKRRTDVNSVYRDMSAQTDSPGPPVSVSDVFQLHLYKLTFTYLCFYRVTISSAQNSDSEKIRASMMPSDF